VLFVICGKRRVEIQLSWNAKYSSHVGISAEAAKIKINTCF